MADHPHALNFIPSGKVLDSFMYDNSFVRGIMGPWGSGKSGGCSVEIFRRSIEQKPGPGNVRRTRWAVIRNTGPQLKMTTIKTWLQWFPEHIFGKFGLSPPLKHFIKLGPLSDGTLVEAEVYFIALDSPEDVNTLYSLELTGAWVNEARFVPKEVIDAATGRVGRYPPMKDGGCTWKGVIMDTNAPAEDHWWAIMAGDKPPPEWMSEEDKLTLVAPENWKFFRQPPAMLEVMDEKGKLIGYKPNPQAENVKNLDPEYYKNTIQGKARAWIQVNILNEYGSNFDGKPVYPSFTPETHASTEIIQPVADLSIYVGMDFGRTPAAVFGQRRGLCWSILAELVTKDMSVLEFARVFRAFVADRFGTGHKLVIFGDPSGDVRAQTRDETPFDILRAAGVAAYPAPSNDLLLRIEAVESVLNRMEGGRPSFLLSSKCPTLKAAMEGGYHYRRLKVSSADVFSGDPEKNRYSHIAEALQYMLLGAGEGRSLLTNRAQPPKVVNVKRESTIWDRDRRVSGWRR
jgi:hypothetical protein